MPVMNNKKILEVSNLSFSYPDKTKALQDVNFTMNKGDSLGIIGNNGAGKSTLLLHLNGVLRGQGTIKIFGDKITKKNLNKIRAKIGIVFQDPNDQLFMPTIFDDIAFGPLNFGLQEKEIVNKVSNILKKFGLYKHRNKPSHHLSFGERKLAALATVLVMEPELIIFDEPTISLDPKSRIQFLNIIKNLDSSKIIATHNIKLVKKICSKILFLKKGKIVIRGNTNTILNNISLLKKHDFIIEED